MKTPKQTKCCPLSEEDIQKWIDEEYPLLEEFTAMIESRVRQILTLAKIEGAQVTSRTKQKSHIKEKIIRKGYLDPRSEMMDIVGVRIVVDIESQIELISGIINEHFKVDPNHSRDKDNSLEVDQIGYRSDHFVCRLDEKRTDLLKKYNDIVFEIQLRTSLQHVWALVSHDRDYKLNVPLPREIRRSLFLYAGLLEIADRGFSALIDQIDRYKTEIDFSSENRSLMELNGITLSRFVEKWCEDNEFKVIPAAIKINAEYSKSIRELADFGILTIGQLEAIIHPRYGKTSKKQKYSTTVLGLVRDWMILHDHDKYVRLVWRRDWFLFAENQEDFNIYAALVNAEKVGKLKSSFV
ncbi:hypothetical protein KBB96_13915 [Luteolibacter ambystomatis]|uniref:RelA/SpoT domain-containing protein n=1 Tax=Luteolibacter ambystomatis TaxID=2824561 RepID=A0A975G603_9BACT|nr:RelA/SpoT domain-containing protein [Luteolibacter ambystomatis]QUE49962.1 hypothetical protein KBB96_13915 [Luteolibacter ambystomatis]